MRTDQGILVEGERISKVGSWSEVSAVAAGATVVDLTGMTVLPGMIDNHTHILLQGDITAQDYDDQLLKESIPYRTIRATAASSHRAHEWLHHNAGLSRPKARCTPTWT